MHLLVRDNAWARQVHRPAHVIVGPAHIERVSHGPRCNVIGRAETFQKNDEPGRAGP